MRRGDAGCCASAALAWLRHRARSTRARRCPITSGYRLANVLIALLPLSSQASTQHQETHSKQLSSALAAAYSLVSKPYD